MVFNIYYESFQSKIDRSCSGLRSYIAGAWVLLGALRVCCETTVETGWGRFDDRSLAWGYGGV